MPWHRFDCNLVWASQTTDESARGDWLGQLTISKKGGG